MQDFLHSDSTALEDQNMQKVSENIFFNAMTQSVVKGEVKSTEAHMHTQQVTLLTTQSLVRVQPMVHIWNVSNSRPHHMKAQLNIEQVNTL